MVNKFQKTQINFSKKNYDSIPHKNNKFLIKKKAIFCEQNL